MLLAGACDCVELRAAVVVDGALIQRQHTARGLLDPARQPVAVELPHALKRLEHHEVERAVRNVGGGCHVDYQQESGRSHVVCQHGKSTDHEDTTTRRLTKTLGYSSCRLR